VPFAYLNLGAFAPQVVEDELRPRLPDGVDPAGHSDRHLAHCLPIRQVVVLFNEAGEREVHVELVGVRVRRWILLELLDGSRAELEVLVGRDLLLVGLALSIGTVLFRLGRFCRLFFCLFSGLFIGLHPPLELILGQFIFRHRYRGMDGNRPEPEQS
jgi:hypothetical protein